MCKTNNNICTKLYKIFQLGKASFEEVYGKPMYYYIEDHKEVGAAFDKHNRV